MITNPVFGNFQTFHKIQIYGILRKNQQKIPKSQIARIRRWNHQESLHPSYSISSHPEWNDSTWQ